MREAAEGCKQVGALNFPNNPHKLMVVMMMLMAVMMTTTRYGSGGTNGPSLAFGGGQVKFGDIL